LLSMTDRRQFLRSVAASFGAGISLDALGLQTGEPSRTAQGTALQRAAHQLLERPVVFDDAFALRVLGAQRVNWRASTLARYVPVDFEKDSLAGRLRAAGFTRTAPAFISWLGVTMYLSRDAVMQTLQFVARSCARGSRIVFDFAPPDDALNDVERQARARRAE